MIQEPSDHDLLIRIDERLQRVENCLVNHLQHHWAVTITALGAAVGAIAAAIIALL